MHLKCNQAQHWFIIRFDGSLVHLLIIEPKASSQIQDAFVIESKLPYKVYVHISLDLPTFQGPGMRNEPSKCTITCLVNSLTYLPSFLICSSLDASFNYDQQKIQEDCIRNYFFWRRYSCLCNYQFKLECGLSAFSTQNMLATLT